MIQGNQVRTQLATDEVHTSIHLGSGRPWGACSTLPPPLCIADSRISKNPEAWLRCNRVVSILLPDGLLTSSVTLTILVSLLHNFRECEKQMEKWLPCTHSEVTIMVSCTASKKHLDREELKAGHLELQDFTHAGELELSSQKRQKYSRVGSHVWSFCHMWSFFPYKAAPAPSKLLDVSNAHI